MKKIALLISFVFIFEIIVFSQSNTFPIPSGNVGIGVINTPTATLHIGSGTGNLHYGNNGVLIKFNNGDRALLELHSPDGQNRLIFQSLSNASYLGSLDLKPLLLQTSGGNIGIGMDNPNSKVVIAEGNNAMSISPGYINSFGFNRNASNGAIFNQSISAWQLSARDERFSIEGYNGAASSPFNILKNGHVGIATINPQYELDVCGTIRVKEVKVELSGGCDFVFKGSYKLMDLNTLETFVKTNRHLPEIASEKEMIKDGVNMKELQMKLLQKIEELTLYTIEQNKKYEEQNIKIKTLKEKIEIIESALK